MSSLSHMPLDTIVCHPHLRHSSYPSFPQSSIALDVSGCITADANLAGTVCPWIFEVAILNYLAGRIGLKSIMGFTGKCSVSKDKAHLIYRLILLHQYLTIVLQD